MEEVVLAGAVRTPIGKFGGTLARFTAVELAAAAGREALRRAGLTVDGELAASDHDRLINVFAKCEPDASGQTRGRRHVMFDDSDINYTRHIRGVVNAVIASVIRRSPIFVPQRASRR